MANVLLEDRSEFNKELSNKYKYPAIIFRSSDGTYRDHHFLANLHYSVMAIVKGWLAFYGVYFVLEENWRQSVNTFIDSIGEVHRPHMFVMIDEESWGGKIKGDHSKEINEARGMIVKALNKRRRRGTRILHKYLTRRDYKRVGLYGNMGDLNALAPHVKVSWFNIAAYGTNPKHAKKVMHQFSDHHASSLGGFVDINSADGYDVYKLARRIGVTVGKNWRKKQGKRLVRV